MLTGSRVRHLPAAEPHRRPHLVALVQELVDVAGFDLEVVLSDLGAEPHPLDVTGAAMTAAALFLLFVLVLAIVNDPAHRRHRRRRHLDEVELSLRRFHQRVTDPHDPQLFAVGPDDPHLSCADFFVYAWLAFDAPAPSAVTPARSCRHGALPASRENTTGTAAAIPGRVSGSLPADRRDILHRPVRSGWLRLGSITAVAAWDRTLECAARA